MEAMREAWTDERLDDLNHRVDNGFKEVSREFQALRLEMRTEFAAVRGEMATEFGSVRGEIAGLRAEMATEFAAVRGEMGAMNRTMIQVGAGFMVTMFVGFAATIATVLTQG
jgi:hypothetical protein